MIFMVILCCCSKTGAYQAVVFSTFENIVKTEDWKPMNLTQRFGAMQHHAQQSHMKDALDEIM